MAISDDAKIWLDTYFNNYKINDDGTIDPGVQKALIDTNIPDDIQFNIASHNFWFNGPNITTLRGSPYTCNDTYRCVNTNIKSLEYCTEHVKWHFYCGTTDITSLKFCPNYVGGDFHCKNTKINDPYEYRYALTCHIGGTFLSGINSVNGIINEYKNCSSEIRPRAFLELRKLRDIKWR